MTIVLTGGTVMTPQGPTVTDVLVGGGRVVEVGVHASRADAKVIDCSGSWIGPGFVDLHVHLREPGQEWKEDIASGSAAAAAGGYTAIVAMPNTEPVVDSGHIARYVTDRGVETGLVDVRPAGTLTLARGGQKLAHLDDLWAAGVRLFTDDGDTVADAGLLRRAMEYVAEIGGVVAQHAEDPGLARGGHMHEGSVSSTLGIPGLPALAEEVIVERDLRLVELTGCRYHVQHVSTSATVDLIRSARERGLPVTAEVTPHHLAFDHTLVTSMDSVTKMYPPLRRPADVEAVKAGLADGTIDAVATDHAPHSAHEKDVPFEEAPRGVIGLETAAAVVNTELGLEPELFFDRMALSPARILGIDHGWLEPGITANLVVFDPSKGWVPTEFVSKSANSPWLNRPLTGQVVATLYLGKVTFQREDLDG